MTDTTIDRARALLILRESVRCADAVSMCNQMGAVLQEMVAEVERLTAEAKQASAEPVAWMTDYKFVCGNGITKSPGTASDWKLAGWRVIELIRRPEMPS